MYTDEMIKKFYNKYIKKWYLEHRKFLFTIILFFLYNSSFLISLLITCGFKFNALSILNKQILMIIEASIYIIILILMYKKELINGFKELNLDKWFIGLVSWVIGCSIMVFSSTIISVIFKSEISNNEFLVREYLQRIPVYMVFSTCICAPLIEEMTFRRALKGFVKNKWIYIVLSGLIFGLMHVVGSYEKPTDFLYIVPYGIMGSAFAFTYEKTKNITLPILIHMIHNTILIMIQLFQ